MGVTDESVRITLRLPEKVRDSLLLSARANRRSMNSEIVSALESHSHPTNISDGGTMEELLQNCRRLSEESVGVVVELTRLLRR